MRELIRMAADTSRPVCLPLEKSPNLPEIATNTMYSPLEAAQTHYPGRVFPKTEPEEEGAKTEISCQTVLEQVGPCQPGAPLFLEGVVWHETQDGSFFHHL